MASSAFVRLWACRNSWRGRWASAPPANGHGRVGGARHAYSSSSPSSSGGDEPDRTTSRHMDDLGSWNSSCSDWVRRPLQTDSSWRHNTLIPAISASSVGCSTQQGRRPYQEDRYTVRALSDQLLLLAVWDGHGGEQCAEFCVQRVERHLRRRLSPPSPPPALDIALRRVFLDLNRAWELHWHAQASCHVDDRDTATPSPGTTATVALLRDGYELVVAQVGDSRAILCRDGRAKCLTRDHCPSDPDEAARIAEHGGNVTSDSIGRHLVNHRLAMSRSIGDLDLKPFGVTAEPDVTRQNIRHSRDKFLVLTTDGVTFVMSDDEIVDFVSTSDTPQKAAERLIDNALLYASEDNVTALVLPLGSWGKGENANTSVLYSLGRNMALSARFS